MLFVIRRQTLTILQSSLTLSVLHGIPTEGTVYYDGFVTSSVNLDVIRSLIPQVVSENIVVSYSPDQQPHAWLELPAGQNLDPFSEYDGAILNNALRAAGLFSLQGKMEGQAYA